MQSHHPTKLSDSGLVTRKKKERCIIAIISYVYVYTACMYDVCMQHTCLVPVELESQRLWATMRVLGAGPFSSVTAASALNS